MAIHLDWQNVALRLALSAIAGLLIGLNRSERGRAAGLRTNILVCLAASIAMIQANLLMLTAGKASDSFVVLDLMRFPLGILSGMGFIGAGTILRKGSLVVGVTTAATLWFVTVMGLCFGGGQIGLGVAALTLGLFVLWFLRMVERRIPQEHHARLRLTADKDAPSEEEIRSLVTSAGYEIDKSGFTLEQAHFRKYRFDLHWMSRDVAVRPPAFVNQLAAQPGIVKLQWLP